MKFLPFIVICLSILMVACGDTTSATQPGKKVVEQCSFTDTYYLLAASAEEKLNARQYKQSYQLYQCAFEGIRLPLKKDAINMAAASGGVGQMNEAAEYIKVAILQGANLAYFENLSRLKKVVASPEYKAIADQYHFLRMEYNNTLDSSIIQSVAEIRAELDREFPLRRNDFPTYVENNVNKLQQLLKEQPINCISEISTKTKKDIHAILEYAFYYPANLVAALPLMEQAVEQGVVRPRDYRMSLSKALMSIRIRTGEFPSDEAYETTKNNLTTRGFLLKGVARDSFLQLTHPQCFK